MISSSNFDFFYFLLARTEGYLVNEFIYPFLDPTQLYNYYWHGGSFNVPRAPTTIGITGTLMFHRFLLIQQGPNIYLSFRFLSVSLCGLSGMEKYTIHQVLFFVDNDKVWSFGRD